MAGSKGPKESRRPSAAPLLSPLPSLVPPGTGRGVPSFRKPPWGCGAGNSGFRQWTGEWGEGSELAHHTLPCEAFWGYGQIHG